MDFHWLIHLVNNNYLLYIFDIVEKNEGLIFSSRGRSDHDSFLLAPIGWLPFAGPGAS